MSHQDFSGQTRSNVGFPMFAMFAVGALAGAAVALTAAPASGRDTRAYLRRRGQEVAADVSSRGGALWREQSHRLTSGVDAGRRRAAGIQERVRAALERGKAAYRAAKHEDTGDGPRPVPDSPAHPF